MDYVQGLEDESLNLVGLMPRGVELPTTYAELQAIKDRIQILIPNEEYLVLDNDNLIAIASGEDAGRIEINGETLDPMYEDTDNETIWGFFECGDAEQPVITEEVKEPTYVTYDKSITGLTKYPYIINMNLNEFNEYLDDNVTINCVNSLETGNDYWRINKDITISLTSLHVNDKIKTTKPILFTFTMSSEIENGIKSCNKISDLNYITTFNSARAVTYGKTNQVESYTDYKTISNGSALGESITFIFEIPAGYNGDFSDLIDFDSTRDITQYTLYSGNVNIELFGDYANLNYYIPTTTITSGNILIDDNEYHYKVINCDKENIINSEITKVNNVITIPTNTYILAVGDDINELFNYYKNGLDDKLLFCDNAHNVFKYSKTNLVLNDAVMNSNMFSRLQAFFKDDDELIKTINDKEFAIIMINPNYAIFNDLEIDGYSPITDGYKITNVD